MIILKNRTMPKIVKWGPFGLSENPIHCKISKKLKGEILGTLKNCRKKSHTAGNEGSFIVPKKVETCFGMLVKKLAHTHRFEHEPSGLKSKHLTARPRTSELCELRAETSCRAKKNNRTFP